MSFEPSRTSAACAQVIFWMLLWTVPLSAQPAPAPTAGTAPASGTAASLSIDDAVARALERNLDLAAAGQRVLSAEARIDKARSFFLPGVTLAGSYTRRLRGDQTVTFGGTQRTTQEADALNGSLTIAVTLFDGRGFPLYRQAKLEREASVLEVAATKRQLAFDTASLFLATLSQEWVLAAANNRVELARKSAHDASERFAAGLASSNDVTQSELELSAAERDLTGARAEVQRARLNLGLLLDRAVTEPLTVPDALLQAAQASAQALARGPAPKPAGPRLEIEALHKHAEALHESAEEPLWRWTPRLGLSATGRATNETGFAGDTLDGSIALTLTWVLWDGGERSADRDDRLAQARAAELQAAASERNANNEVQQALVSLDRGRNVLEQSTRTADIARRNASETGELYRQGLGTAFAVADASTRLFAAEVELAQARYDLAVGLLALRHAIGLDPFGKEPVR